MMDLSNFPLDDWIILIKKHTAQRPQMQARDIYKLLYQGMLGPEHLIASPSVFAERLLGEYEGVLPDQGDSLYEAIRPDLTLLRVNLRPFKAARLDLEALLDACLQTAEITWGEPAELRHLWSAFVGAYHQHPFAAPTSAELDELTDLLTAHDYPAVHHSHIYRQAYVPAYRLLGADYTALLHGNSWDGHTPSQFFTGGKS